MKQTGNILNNILLGMIIACVIVVILLLFLNKKFFIDSEIEVPAVPQQKTETKHIHPGDLNPYLNPLQENIGRSDKQEQSTDVISSIIENKIKTNDLITIKQEDISILKENELKKQEKEEASIPKENKTIEQEKSEKKELKKETNPKPSDDKLGNFIADLKQNKNKIESSSPKNVSTNKVKNNKAQLRMGSFSTRQQAEIQQKKLKSLGIASSIKEINISQKIYYRVISNTMNTYEAKNIQNKLNLNKIESNIVSIH